ncbi:MAG: ABC transporter permease [Acidimicrobiales bacterium]
MTTLARQDLRLLLADPIPTLMLPVMAVGLMTFIEPAFDAVIADHYGPGFGGAEQAVPGMAVMFGFFLVANGAFALFREHEWNTWVRLRVSEIRAVDVLVGKALLPVTIALLYFVVVFGFGFTVLGLHRPSSFAALALVVLAFSVTLASLSLALVAMARSVMEVNALGSLCSLLFAGLGGALTPYEVLPAWARAISWISPGYWAMEGFRAGILVSEPTRAAMCAMVLLGFAAGFSTLAGLRFRMDETKATA